MSIFAVGLPLVVAIILSGYGTWNVILWRTLRRVGLVTPDELPAGAADGDLVAVAGRAGPGPAGELTSTVNGQPCVWHRHTITHRSNDQRLAVRWLAAARRPERDHSRKPFTIAGTGSAIDIEPEGMRVDRPAMAGRKMLPAKASQPMPVGFSGTMREVYVHREWIIRTGTPLVVLGQLAHRGGRIYLRRPRTGPGLISTRSRDRLIQWTLATSIAQLAAALLALILAAVIMLG